ncbi:site-specific integrase, partial [Treponema sp. OttesenSCG-928-L16]|nr:site-specific integrase [Treponema sp. OttesenSCG-928-L16]
KQAPDDRKEKGILSPDEVHRLIKAPATDPRHRLAVLLGLVCGMRLGEVRGLLWEDVGDGIISIRHNYVDSEGLKTPKYDSSGQVPFSDSVAAMLEAVRRISRNPGPRSFILDSLECPGKPYASSFLRKALSRELIAIGISKDEQKHRNITFHSLRHTFITLGRLAGISDMEIQVLARHRSGAMMERYSHASQVLDFDSARQRLKKAIGE